MKGVFSLVFVLFISLFSFVNISAQTQENGFNPTESSISRSPEAAAIIKYIDFPVSYYTGTPEISIPVFSISERDLSVNISLSYHASGNKVSDVASYVGLGWNLGGIGMITRKVRGMADDSQLGEGFLEYIRNSSPNTYQDVLDVFTNENFEEAAALSCPYKDAEPDEYYFSFGGYSGTFTFDWNGNPIVNSAQKIIIEPPVQDPNTNEIPEWRIKTPDGVTYIFGGNGAKEMTEYSSGGGGDPGTCDPGLEDFYVSGW